MELKKAYYVRLVREALKEDLGKAGDVSTIAVFTGKEEGTFRLIAKDRGILCGKAVFEEVFRQLDRRVSIEWFYDDGAALEPQNIVARVRGSVKSILMGERTALNFICHLSGVATRAHQLVSISRQYGGSRPVQILDTRKTLPGFRMLQKYAVATGGAANHRIGLYDMVLLKDNHIDAAGGITAAVERVRKKWGRRFKIEVETRTLADVQEALALGVDRIMLDNMDNEKIRQALEIIGGRIETEASGNMNEERLAQLAGTGLTYISFGELTHSVRAFDFSLKHEKGRS
ncbi:MAG TPA: carboxylating nicotinate-nucleotide diphosphorylase [Termitinemataceae bacterium]|nr:carboxylating nicotinate-nucleotide diphosphorylase [Termitinemataceae bacterium]HOM24076.1 carboxylating nicotinate-nucleotide diphosphorylase [Termitinemataceae bacterium]HPQ01363.1 carboxylating nicotinate-nucleotide diphosphorylase [Termitinemataceae bacterium]